MRKILILLLLSSIPAYATPPTRAYTYVSNTTIDPNQNNTNENSLYSYLQTGVDTYAAGSITGAAVSSSASIPYASLSLSNSIVRGDLTTSVTNYLLPAGAAFFMFTGSCPSGTTDISATWANKFIKINATAGTSSGVVLTGTTDSHIITTAELPASALTVSGSTGNGSGNTTIQFTTNGGALSTMNTSNLGSGGGHTHTLSSATTLEPSSVTARLCQVN